MITPCEYLAMRRQWEAAHGKPELTAEQKANLEAGRRYILEAQARAHNKQVEARRQSQLKIVERRSNG